MAIGASLPKLQGIRGSGHERRYALQGKCRGWQPPRSRPVVCRAGPRHARNSGFARPHPRPDEALIKTLWSGISRGTERLVFEGRVPASECDTMRAPFQCGAFPFPVKYGYSAVGHVEVGPHHLVGRTVFALHPHQDFFVAPAGRLNLVARPSAGAPRHARRQYGDRPQRSVGFGRRPRRPHRRDRRGSRRPPRHRARRAAAGRRRDARRPRRLARALRRAFRCGLCDGRRIRCRGASAGRYRLSCQRVIGRPRARRRSLARGRRRQSSK